MERPPFASDGPIVPELSPVVSLDHPVQIDER